MTKLFANESELMEYRLDQIEKQLEIKNKLELLKMGYEAGIVTEEQYKESLLNCRKVLFGK